MQLKSSDNPAGFPIYNPSAPRLADVGGKNAGSDPELGIIEIPASNPKISLSPGIIR